MSYTKRAVKGFVLLLFMNVAAAVFGYLIRIVMARNLSVEGYGLFFAIFTLIMFAAIFNSLGMGEALVKYIPHYLVKKREDKVRNGVFTATVVQIIIMVLLAIVLLIFAKPLGTYYFKSPLASTALLLFLPLLLFMNLRGLLRCIFQAFQRVLIFASIYLIENIMILVLLLLFGSSLLRSINMYTIGYASMFFVFTIILFKRKPWLRRKPGYDKDLTKKLLKFGIPVVLAGLGGLIILYTDTLVLTYFRSLTDVGIYNVVVPTVMAVLFFGKSLSTITLPLLSELYAKKLNSWINLGLSLMERYALMIVIPMCMILLVLSKTIIVVLFGVDYSSGALPMQILMVGMIFLVLYSIHATVFSSMGKPEIATKILLKGAAINLSANFLFVPWLGMTGAAITSLITYAYIMVESKYRLNKEVGAPMYWSDWLKPAGSGLLMIAVMFLVQIVVSINVFLEAILIAGVGGLVYVALMFLFKGVNVKQIMEIKEYVFKK